MEVITGTIGYGVVGSGYFGAELARIMNTKQGAQIRAVYDPENGGPVAAELGCDAEDSLESCFYPIPITTMWQDCRQ